MPDVRATDLIIYRGRRALFERFSFSVRAGECVLLLGENGAGKTTLLDCICRRYRNWSGSLDCSQCESSYLPQVGPSSQTLPLDRLARLVVGFDPVEYQHLLRSFALATMTHAIPNRLSGGERQRIRVLLSLLRRHSLLMLDEPFANLDSLAKESLVRELQRPRRQRATIIVSHPGDTDGVMFSGIRTYELSSNHH